MKFEYLNINELAYLAIFRTNDDLTWEPDYIAAWYDNNIVELLLQKKMIERSVCVAKSPRARVRRMKIYKDHHYYTITQKGKENYIFRKKL